MSTTFKRIVKSGWKGFRRNSGLSMATIFIMVLTIALISSLFLMQHVSGFIVASLEEKVDMAVYFVGEPSSEEIMTIQGELFALPEVRQMEYISKEEALSRFIQRHEGEEVIIESLEEVGGNPLLASLNIRAFEASQYAAISTFLENSSFRDLISKVDYVEKKSAIEKLFSLTSSINTTGIIFSVVLAVIAVLISFNTVRIAIYNSRDEIETMRLVGAANSFIRGPFLVQGAVAGILAVLITFLLFLITVMIFGPKIELIIPGLNLSGYFFGHFFVILLIQLATGMGLGMFSSWIAVRRYLKI